MISPKADFSTSRDISLHLRFLEEFFILFDLLFQVLKQIAVEEVADGNIYTVANLLDGNDTGVLAFFVQHTVDRGRSNAREISQCVHGKPFFLAELQNAFCNRFFGIHASGPFHHDISQ